MIRFGRAFWACVGAVSLGLTSPVSAREATSHNSDDSQPPCHGAISTREMNACYADVLAAAEERQAQYLGSALERHKAHPNLAAMISSSDAAFNAYRDAECGAVLEDWKEGTIRGVMLLTCRIKMTDRRTHTIWQNWLTYQDSTPPVLPEPEPMPH